MPYRPFANDSVWHLHGIVVRLMTMIKLTDAQRAVLIQAFPAVGHLGLGALAFGQFLREQTFSGWLAIAGIAIWVVCVAMAVVVAGGSNG